jgi:SAM-dependent methyltransferase
MTHEFDKDYWESHWQRAEGRDAVSANPYLARETSGLVPGTALDAGCGEGAEAIWLAEAGWQVTAADISTEALARAAGTAKGSTAAGRVRWVEADLGAWEPEGRFDLVTTHYAHPAMPQLAFYARIADWVAPGGTLLVVGHGHRDHDRDHDHGHHHGHGHPPLAASVTAASITAGLDAARWDVLTADEPFRTVTRHGGEAGELHDVVVRATRRPLA